VQRDVTAAATEGPIGSRARRFVLVLAGLLVLQTAWILATAPFRAIDEPHHVFRASAVGHGDWSLGHDPDPRGDGELLHVPTATVAAALPACEAMNFLSREECLGVPDTQKGSTTVGSWYSRYNPGYYAVVGTAALPFTGVSALYVMRAVSALLCALLLTMAVVLLTERQRTPVVGIACVLAATPILVYSSSVVAPNGPELCAAFLLWAALLRLAVDAPSGLEHARRTRLLVLGTAAAAMLVTFRTLGPLWCMGIVAACAVLAGRQRVTHLLGTRAARWSVVVVGAATLLGVGWTVLAGTNQNVSDGGYGGSPVRAALGLLDDWLVQSVAAFPSRNEYPAPLVHVLVIGAWLVLVAQFLRTCRGRPLLAWLLTLACSLSAPLAFTVLTWHRYGDTWQGRYGYPVTMGLLLLAGVALDRRLEPAPMPRVVLSVWFVVVVAQVFSIAGVLHRQEAVGATFRELGATAPPPAALVLLAVVGVSLLSLGAFAPSGLPSPAGTTTERAHAHLG
jgi:hypothetical protein